MATVTIQEPLWRNFVSHAQESRRKPEAVVRQLLRDYIQRAEDEKLLADSIRIAQRSPYSIAEAEAMIKRIRRERGSRKGKNGRT